MNQTKLQVKQKPLIFDEFFELGQQETLSPFLTESSRNLASHLTFKSSLLALVLLVCSYLFSFSQNLLPLSQVFLIGVYFLAGIPALIEAIEDLFILDINIDILMTLAAFSSVLIGSSLEGGLLLVLFALSGSLEDAVSGKAKSAISSLHQLSPSKATVIDEDGTLIDRSIKDIPVGTHILVKASQVVPLDGVVIDGISSVNLYHLTGENFPIKKEIHDQVPAGAKNLDGALTLKVTATSHDSTLSKIIELVTEAQEAKPKLQQFFDHFSSRYAISIILLATLFTLIFPFIFDIPFFGREGSLYRSLSFLIAASPCALIIAIPIAYLSALSVSARHGILLKGGMTLDALHGCKILALDKTGTVTTGDLEVISIQPLGEKNAIQEAISLAYALEKNAVHPVAKAIIQYAIEQNISSSEIQEFKQVAGFGLMAKSKKGEQIVIGRPEFVASKLQGINGENLLKKTEPLLKKGELISCLSIDQDTYLFSFKDHLRPLIKSSIDTLKKNQKLKIVMLTGDHEYSAKKIASELQIDEYYADLTPENKLDLVSQLSENQNLAMCGDGVNDAPALARASVGICMGKLGSRAAIDASDIVLLHDNIELLDWLFTKAHQTNRIVKQNLTLALTAIIFAALPAIFGWIPLWLAVILHEGGTVLVGLNALRLLKK